MSSRVFVLIKSESYKNMGYSSALLATSGCCVYTCRRPSSLFQEETNYTHPICALLFVFFPLSVTFVNLKYRLLDSLNLNIERQSGVAKTKLFVGNWRENRLEVFNFLRGPCKDATQ